MAFSGVVGASATRDIGSTARYHAGMERATAPAGELVPEVVDGQREQAYLLWAWKLDRNAAEVGRALGVPPRTVQRWAVDDDWKGRREAERRSLGRRARAGLELRVLGVVDDLAASLVRIATGQGDTITTLTRRGEVVEVDYPVPYQARVHAANSLLDRLGIVPGAPADEDDRDEDDPDDEPTDAQDAAERHRRRLERMRREGKP